jgi:signal transduction histidine kinase
VRLHAVRGTEAAGPPALDLPALIAANIHEMKNLVGEMTLAMDRIGGRSAEAATARFLSRRVSDRMVQILTLYRMSNGRTHIDGADHVPSDLLQEVAADAVALAGPGVSVELDVAEAPPWWWLDRELVQMALANATHNALRYAAERIVLSVRGADGDIAFRVEDDGGGFPDAVLDRARGGFRDVPVSGAGLGLYFAQVVAEAHRSGTRTGQLKLENRAGRPGTVVTLWLPERGFSAGGPLKRDVAPASTNC